MEKQWYGVDSELSETQIDNVLYAMTKDFLFQYFNQKSSQDSVDDACVDLIDDEMRAIPGGRYGCTQYLKFCGPEEIRALSVGRISLMIKQAIKEDVLRHHKTLLVWSASVDKHKSTQIEDEKDPQEDAKVAGRACKLNQVKQALIEILAESKQGMSLAQLP